MLPTPARTHADTDAAPASPWLWNMLAPAADPRDPLASAHLVATLPAGPVALEIAAEPDRLRLLARAWDAAAGQALTSSLYAAFPQARLTLVSPADDPARPAGPGEHGRALELVLHDPEYFPLHTYDRAAVEQQGDPLAVLVRAMQSLGPGERCLLRLTLAPAPADWARRYRPLLHAARRADEAGQVERRVERRHERGDGGGPGFLLLLGALALGLWAWPAISALRAGQAPPGPLGRLPWAWLVALPPLVLGLAAGLALALLLAPLLVLVLWWRRRPELPTPALLLTKLDAPGCLVRLHVLAWGPDPAGLDARLRHVAAALPLYARADGNQLRARPARLADSQQVPALRRPFRRARVLAAGELAGLWGPVGGLTDAGELVRAGATRRRPPRYAPDGRPWLSQGCPLGTSEQGGVARPVAFPDELYGRVGLLLGKSGAGKSIALLHLLAHALAEPARGVVLIDPHGDLAHALLGHIPPARHADVISLDLGATDRPVGLNLLDVSAGRRPDRIAADTIASLRRLWTTEDGWGPRMELVLRQCLITLAERNTALPPEEQFTLLHVEPLLEDAHFRATVLQELGPPVSNAEWWTSYYARRSERLREEVINPVLNRMAALSTVEAARHIIGQPQSSVDLRAAVLAGRIVVVSLAQGTVGEDLAALLGALIASEVDQAIAGQAAVPPGERRRVLLAIDELQTLPAVDYARLVGELRKFGGGFLLATQSLTALERVAPTLPPLLLGNTEALLSFRVSAADAALLAPELDEAVTVTDLINLEAGCGYLKLSERGQPAPATWLRVHPPPPTDTAAAAALHEAGREDYGVPVEQAAARVAAGRARVQQLAEVSLGEEARATGEAAADQDQAPPAGAVAAPATTSPAPGEPAGAADPPARTTRRSRRPSRPAGPLPLPGFSGAVGSGTGTGHGNGDHAQEASHAPAGS